MSLSTTPLNLFRLARLNSWSLQRLKWITSGYNQRHVFTVVEKSSYQEKKVELSKNVDSIAVLQLSTAWCGPCRKIKPEIQLMSEKYPKVEFLYIDIDDVPDAGDEYGVKALPTFVFLKGDKTIDVFEGAQKEMIERKVQEIIEK